MKNIYTYILIIIITISCNNHYKSAEEYYLLGQFDAAKHELSKVKETDADYKKTELLTIKLDSTYYQLASEQYSNNYLEKASDLLRNIDFQSSLFDKKIALMEQISKKNDSVIYQQAFEQYSNNYFENSTELLKKIPVDSPLNEKKVELLTRISKKIKQNSIKEKYISKAVISSIFGPSPSIMKIKEDDSGVFIVSYYSRDAGKSYSYKVKFENNKAFWGADDGEWRYDDISYTETNDAYYIIEKYVDGSTRKDKFYKTSLK